MVEEKGELGCGSKLGIIRRNVAHAVKKEFVNLSWGGENRSHT